MGKGRGWEDHPHHQTLPAAGHPSCELRAYNAMGPWRTPAVQPRTFQKKNYKSKGN